MRRTIILRLGIALATLSLLFALVGVGIASAEGIEESDNIPTRPPIKGDSGQKDNGGVRQNTEKPPIRSDSPPPAPAPAPPPAPAPAPQPAPPPVPQPAPRPAPANPAPAAPSGGGASTTTSNTRTQQGTMPNAMPATGGGYATAGNPGFGAFLLAVFAALCIGLARVGVVVFAGQRARR